MHPNKLASGSLALLLIESLLVGQQATVVPAPYATTDAISYEWIAGASRPLRQQTLIGASHLTSLANQTITALELRRSAANEVYIGGSMDLTVTLSIAPIAPIDALPTFAANVGPAPTTVFSGTVTLPTSPAVSGGPGSQVAWTSANTLLIPLQTPFLYTGGTLCIDVTGQPIAGQSANWWMADAEFEDIAGSVANLGGGCGAYGGPQHEWSFVATRTLVPGGHGRFFAYGPPLGFGLAAFGSRSPGPIPMALLGLGSPVGCDLYIGQLFALMIEVFESQATPQNPGADGMAEVRLKIPSDASVLGLTMTTQWIEWSQAASSNALEWTIASAIPSLDMALVEGLPTESGGELSVHLAPVWRLTSQ